MNKEQLSLLQSIVSEKAFRYVEKLDNIDRVMLINFHGVQDLTAYLSLHSRRCLWCKCEHKEYDIQVASGNGDILFDSRDNCTIKGEGREI